MSNLKRNFLWLLGSKAFLITSGLITGSLINRSLGPSGRGALAEVQTWAGLFIVIFGISIDTAIYHFADRVTYKEDDKTKFATVFFLNVIYAFLAALVLTLFVFYWPHHFSSKMIELLFLLNICLIISMLAANLTVFFQAIGNIKFAAIIGITQAFINFLIIGFGYLTRNIDVKFILISMIIFQSVALTMLLVVSLKSGLIFGYISKIIAKGLILAGLKQHVATIATFVYTAVNQLIVFKYCGPSEAGIFSVALVLANCFIFIPGTFQTALYPRIIHSKDDYEVTTRSLRLGFYIWGGIVALIILSAKPLLLVYGGGKFLPSVNVFRILMLGAWFLPLSSLLAPYYVKKGAFGIASFSAAILGAISMALNIALVPRFAALGAAIATSLTCLIGFCMVVLFLFYLSRKNPFVIFKPDFKKEISFIRGAYLRRA